MAFNKKTHLRQNIDALKTAFTLDRERRAPTPEEERTLGAYSGFGAIKEVLENPTGKPDKDGMATLVAELHEVIRANTPDEREYKRYMDGIKNSVLTAFYTPPKVADAIVEAIWDTRIPVRERGFSSVPWISTPPMRRSPASRKTPPRG